MIVDLVIYGMNKHPIIYFSEPEIYLFDDMFPIICISNLVLFFFNVNYATDSCLKRVHIDLFSDCFSVYSDFIA